MCGKVMVLRDVFLKGTVSYTYIEILKNKAIVS